MAEFPPARASFTAPIQTPRAVLFVMLGIVIVLCAGQFFYKYYLSKAIFTDPPYIHMLVDYDFGFMRRALIGQIAKFVFPAGVSVKEMLRFDLVVWLAALGLYLLAFRRDFGLTTASLPFAIFAAGSPFFFKNYMLTLGYLDIYGFMVAVLALLLPPRRWAMVLLGALCVVLLLIHHIHALLFIPLIGCIVLFRLMADRRLALADIAIGALTAAAVGALFIVMMFKGAPPVSEAVFTEHVLSRASDPVPLKWVMIWYTTLENELLQTSWYLPKNALRIPAYLGFLALHWPLWAYARRLAGALPDKRERVMLYLFAALMVVCYVVIMAVLYDWARFVSDWFVCLVLLMHLARERLNQLKIDVPPLAIDTRLALGMAMFVTLWPRMGTGIPF